MDIVHAVPFGSSISWHQAQVLIARGQTDAARVVLERMRAAAGPNDAHPQLLASQIAMQEGRFREASACALEAARVAPPDGATLCAVSSMLMAAGERHAAHVCLERFQLADCGDPLILMRAADLRKRMEQPVESLALLDRAESLGKPDPALRYCRGIALIATGRLEEAEAELSASLAAAPEHGIVAVPLVRLRRQTRGHNWLSLIERGAQATGLSVTDRAAFAFARYKSLDDLGRHEEAARELGLGNALMFGQLGDDAASLRGVLNQLLLEQTKMTALQAPRNEGGPRPVFIVGSPRSGTTVLERLLCNHRNIVSAGELVDFRLQLHWMTDASDMCAQKFIGNLHALNCAVLGERYLAQTQWRAGGATVYVDKQPLNWMFVGAIHAALPEARILHLVRDPIDTCFSNWRLFFGEVCGYTYDQRAMAYYFLAYQQAMAYWSQHTQGVILDVPYAELVSDPEASLQRVFNFIGVPQQTGCSDLTSNWTATTTPSAAQVRGKLDRDMHGLWRPYARQLGTLLQLLGNDKSAMRNPAVAD